MKRAFIFPGQGSQFVGMGKDFYDNFPVAKQVFAEVDDSLSQKLSKIIFEGPLEDLTLTENTQPALMAVSMAVLRTLMDLGGFKLENLAAYLAGHSLGEYSALCAAGAFDISTTAKLLRIRGSAMQLAVPVGIGAMAALLGLDFEAADKVAKSASQPGSVCSAANDNAPGQVVISGHKEAVERAMELAKDQGAKRSILLPVSAPFHSALMQPAADRMAEALSEAKVHDIQIPVIANITARPILKADDIRSSLVSQVTSVVRWRESMESLKTLNVASVTEIGAGKVLCGLMKRIDADIAAASVGMVTELDEAVAVLS